MTKRKDIWQKHRILVIVLLAVIIGAAIGAGYGAWSGAAWKNYQVSYEQWYEDVKRKLDQAQNLPAKTDDEKTRKLDAYKQIATSLNQQKAHCESPQLAQWQESQQENARRKEACAKLNERTAAFNGSLSEIIEYLESERALAVLLEQVRAEEKLAEKTWAAQSEEWQKLQSGIEKLPADGAFASVRKGAIAQTKAVATAWQKLVAANKAKDETAFAKAKDGLEAAYEGLGVITDESSEQLRRLQESLDTRYSDAF